MPILKQLRNHAIILDTHVWIWVSENNQSLSSSFKKAIQRCQDRKVIYISPISIWEIGMLVEKSRITLDRDVLEWVEEALDVPGINIAHISPRIAIQSTRLPNNHHADPADRLLIATAHELNAVLVTCDSKILSFGSQRFISVHNPQD